MSPRLAPGTTLLLDRHYNSLQPYRKNDLNLYAVLKNDACAVRYAKVTENRVILRPHNPASPIEVIPIENGKSLSDYLVGRIWQFEQEV